MEPGDGVFHELMWLPPGDREDRTQPVGLVGMLRIFSLPRAKRKAILDGNDEQSAIPGWTSKSVYHPIVYPRQTPLSWQTSSKMWFPFCFVLPSPQM